MSKTPDLTEAEWNVLLRVALQPEVCTDRDVLEGLYALGLVSWYWVNYHMCLIPTVKGYRALIATGRLVPAGAGTDDEVARLTKELADCRAAYGKLLTEQAGELPVIEAAILALREERRDDEADGLEALL